MINILKNITRIEKLKKNKTPKHLAIALSGIDIGKEEFIKKAKFFIDFQIEKDIPILSLNIDAKFIDFIGDLVDFLLDSEFIKQRNIRFFIIGDWFDLDVNITEKIKRLIDLTTDKDKFFVNLMIKYNPRKELLSAVKVLTLKLNRNLIKEADVNEDTLKNALFTSYFIPPDILIETSKNFSGTMLWDLPGSCIHKCNVDWNKIDKKILESVFIRCL